MKRLVLVLFVAGILILSAMWATMFRHAKSGITPAGVSTVQAKNAARPKNTRVVAAGLVEPAGEEYRVSSQLEGRLARVFVDEGSWVTAGMVIAQLENADYVARVDRARAEVQSRQAQLDRLRAGSREQERREAEARLRQAEAREVAARKELERRRPLLETGAISRSEFDQALREENTAAAAADQARAAYELVIEQTRPEDLRRAAADLDVAQAQLAEAQALLDKTSIRAPISGRVLRRWKKRGESVSAIAGADLLSIGDLSRLQIRTDVDETDVARVHLGQQAYVTAEAYPGIKFSGHIVRIGQELGRKKVFTDEPTERVDKKTLEALVQLDPGQKLPVGLRVDVFIE